MKITLHHPPQHKLNVRNISAVTDSISLVSGINNNNHYNNNNNNKNKNNNNTNNNNTNNNNIDNISSINDLVSTKLY